MAKEKNLIVEDETTHWGEGGGGWGGDARDVW